MSKHIALAAHKASAETVLVIDDDPGIRAILARVLARAGIAVLIAASGQEALAMHQAEAASITSILLDMAMPHMNGVQVLCHLRSAQTQAQIIMMSGDFSAGDLVRLAPCAPYDLLYKPFALTDVAAILREPLASRLRASLGPEKGA